MFDGMVLKTLSARLPLVEDPIYLLLVFFLYSFAGYVVECIVLTIDNHRLVTNRGFTSHLPLCIIYGFGSLGGYILLAPLKDSPLLLFAAGALLATFFEYITAIVQLRLFGSFWWDYSKKPFNYRGILCLESTLAWGMAAIVVVRYLNGAMVGLARQVPVRIAAPAVAVLVLAYTLDFVISARRERIRLRDASACPQGAALEENDRSTREVSG